MASKVDIWNLALANIGHKANIADPDETSVEANHCRRFYPIALGVTLERFAWGFATRRKALGLVTNPVNHWMFAYALPNQCIAPRAVLPPQSTDDTKEQPFTIESAADGSAILYTNVEDAVLKYTALVEDTNKFSHLFVTALSFDLAAMLVGPIPKDPKKRQEMQQLAAFYTSQAEAADANATHDSTYGTFIPSHLAAR
ncbi:hypothetical protein [Propionivibrio dicarboxylicus]|uniref:Uncharacterized protein n=1 Tax=Propionivibrio dicarboxylicus TaxID=83767 RepID=A0A1G8APY7_9RHOO|nr:hypothetical protein [Propionivibrio dicarboxylicus]SDH22933.1 hypothetical protein SAMN05660652_01457 [Propionivibrio dicarboxylicus]